MRILDLVTELMKMSAEHGNLEVRLESLPIKRIEKVRAILGEHDEYIDLESYDDLNH